MMKSFKPLLAPNQKVNLEEINYPLLASVKLDGIRCIIKSGQILSRSLKEIPNKQIKEKLEPLRKFTEDNDCLFDGEIYSHDLNFQQIISCVMTEDYEDKKAVKKWEELSNGISKEDALKSLKFWCFDCLDEGMIDDCYFKARLDIAKKYLMAFQNIAKVINHKEVNSAKEVTNYFEEVLEQGFEGLILRDPEGRYKYGRGTVKEGIIYKCKKFIDFDGQIFDVVQATEVNENAEKKKNELGRSVTSKKKGDRHLIKKASAFWVKWEGKELKVTLAMTDEEKEKVWRNRESYIGRWITFKGMVVGSKSVPRHPVMIRFREEK